MPRGFESAKEAFQEIQDRKNAGGSGGGKIYFRLGDGESATVRFLEQGDDIYWTWVHTLPPAPGRQVGDKIPCRQINDEGDFTGADCPGCEQQLKRSYQGAINVIWRDSPVYERDANGRLVKQNGVNVVSHKADQNAVWVSGPTVFGELEVKDATYRGLASRDFRVTRRGGGYDTKYSIEPADPDAGPQPLNDADLNLVDTKYDLTPFVASPAYEVWGKQSASPARTETSEVRPADTSPFRRNRD